MLGAEFLSDLGFVAACVQGKVLDCGEHVECGFPCGPGRDARRAWSEFGRKMASFGETLEQFGGRVGRAAKATGIDWPRP